MLKATDEKTKKLFRALIRMHYSEWDYNTHLGGASLQTLLFGQNRIFDLGASADELEFEVRFLVLEDAWYPEEADGISLGGGYWDGGIHTAIRGDLEFQLLQLVRRSFSEHHFLLEDETVKLLMTVLSDIESTVKQDKPFFRARIGVKRRYIEKQDSFKKTYAYLPYTNGELAAPPLHLAGEGRLNRHRVPILYLATDRATAVAEVRPHPGHLVSTAEFRALSDLKIADFTKADISDFLSDERLELLRLILSFDELLNLPVQPEKHEFYIVTQLLADCLRKIGFEGVMFRSSLGSGQNLACFAPKRFEQVNCSEQVLEVNGLAYSLEVPTTLPQIFDSEDFMEDGADPLSTMFDGLQRRR